MCFVIRVMVAWNSEREILLLPQFLPTSTSYLLLSHGINLAGIRREGGRKYLITILHSKNCLKIEYPVNTPVMMRDPLERVYIKPLVALMLKIFQE